MIREFGVGVNESGTLWVGWVWDFSIWLRNWSVVFLKLWVRIWQNDPIRESELTFLYLESQNDLIYLDLADCHALVTPRGIFFYFASTPGFLCLFFYLEISSALRYKSSNINWTCVFDFLGDVDEWMEIVLHDRWMDGHTRKIWWWWWRSTLLKIFFTLGDQNIETWAVSGFLGERWSFCRYQAVSMV